MTEVQFWSQVLTDAERTVICPPDLESRLKGYIDAHGMSGAIHVKATPICPEDRVLVLDEHAIEASLRQAIARPIRIIT